MFAFAGMNWLTVLVATVVGFALGGIWYSPLFGKAWLAAIGKSENEIQPSPGPFIISIITALVTSIALAILVRGLGLTSSADGIVLGLITGVGFIATAMASDSAFWGGG